MPFPRPPQLLFDSHLQLRLQLATSASSSASVSNGHFIFVFTMPTHIPLYAATSSSSLPAAFPTHSTRYCTTVFNSPLQLRLYHYGHHSFHGQSFKLPLNRQALPSVEVWCEHGGEAGGEDGVVEQHSNRCIRAREGCDDFPRLNRHACAAELPDSTDCRLAFQPVFQELCIGWA